MFHVRSRRSERRAQYLPGFGAGYTPLRCSYPYSSLACVLSHFSQRFTLPCIIIIRAGFVGRIVDNKPDLSWLVQPFYTLDIKNGTTKNRVVQPFYTLDITDGTTHGFLKHQLAT